MDLVAYLRTSTANGGQEDSLEEQERACRAWASDNGHDVVCVCRDEGVSGQRGIAEREGLAAALVDVENPDSPVTGLVVHRLDRLARELHVQEAALAAVWQQGGRVYEAVAGEVMQDDPDDPMRKAMRQMAGVFAELERGMIAARLRGGRKRKRSQPGGYLGGPTVPLGYRVQGKGKAARLVEDRNAQLIVKRVVDLREQGLTHVQVAEMLNHEGVPTARGGRWHVATVQRVLKRAAY